MKLEERLKRAEKYRDRYKNDLEFREKVKKKARDYYNKYKKKDENNES